MNKLERLLNLTAALLDADRPLTATELRHRVDGYPAGTKVAFMGTFSLDKAALRKMGIPVCVELVPGTDPPVEGYRLRRDDYAGVDSQFEPDELAALHLATKLIPLDGSATGLIKLGAASSTTPVDPVGDVPFNDRVATLIAAAADRQAVTFRYHDLKRKVEPWRVSFTRGRWYLAGWDHYRQGVRIYRVDRFDGGVGRAGPATEPVGEIFDPLDLRGWEMGDGPVELARLRIDRDRAAWARQIIGKVEDQDDGSVVATLSVRSRGAFRAFVLNFLDHAEVLGPPELRADFLEWLENLR